MLLMLLHRRIDVAFRNLNPIRKGPVNLCFNLGVALWFGLLTEWFAAAVLDESKCRRNHSLKRKSTSFDQSRSPGRSLGKSMGAKTNKARKGTKFITRLAIRLFKRPRKEKNDSEMSRCPFLRETRLNLNKIKQTFITL